MDTLIATAIAALFAGCWVMEMRSSRKMREGELKRYNEAIRDHIRAIAEDLRTQANICEDQEGSYLSPLMLRTFADRLEGKNENT